MQSQGLVLLPVNCGFGEFEDVVLVWGKLFKDLTFEPFHVKQGVWTGITGRSFGAGGWGQGHCWSKTLFGIGGKLQPGSPQPPPHKPHPV